MKQNKFFPITFAFGTAIILTFVLVTPTIAQFKAERDTHKNCLTAKFPKDRRHSIDFDSDSGLVSVKFVDDQGAENETLLNFKSNDGFAGCTGDATDVLKQVKTTFNNRESDICRSMKDVLNGKLPLPESGDVHPTLNDVKTLSLIHI